MGEGTGRGKASSSAKDGDVSMRLWWIEVGEGYERVVNRGGGSCGGERLVPGGKGEAKQKNLSLLLFAFSFSFSPQKRES